MIESPETNTWGQIITIIVSGVSTGLLWSLINVAKRYAAEVKLDPKQSSVVTLPQQQPNKRSTGELRAASAATQSTFQLVIGDLLSRLETASNSLGEAKANLELAKRDCTEQIEALKARISALEESNGHS